MDLLIEYKDGSKTMIFRQVSGDYMLIGRRPNTGLVSYMLTDKSAEFVGQLVMSALRREAKVSSGVQA